MVFLSLCITFSLLPQMVMAADTTSITFTDEAKAEIVSFTDEDDNEITEDMYGSLTPDIQYSLVMRVPIEIEVDYSTFSSNDDTYFYYDFYPYEGEEISVSLAKLATIEFDSTAAGYTVKMERRTGGFGTVIFNDFEVDKNGKTELTPGVYEIESVEPLCLITADGQTSVPWMTYYYAYNHYYYYFVIGQYASDIKVWVYRIESTHR